MHLEGERELEQSGQAQTGKTPRCTDSQPDKHFAAAVSTGVQESSASLTAFTFAAARKVKSYTPTCTDPWVQAKQSKHLYIRLPNTTALGRLHSLQHLEQTAASVL